MRQFYISDPRMFELKMSDFDFKLYSYLCKNYDLKRLTPFVRMIDCADHMIVPLPKIKAALQRLSILSIDYTLIYLVTNISWRLLNFKRTFLIKVSIKLNRIFILIKMGTTNDY